MNEHVLLDTGPLVALLDRRDRYHDWAASVWGRVAPPMVTCEAVLSEACFLLAGYPTAVPAVFDLVRRKVIRVPFQLENDLESVARLMAKYADVPMSLADACLVRMAECCEGAAVFTVDSDFERYRIHGRRVLPLIAPRDA